MTGPEGGLRSHSFDIRSMTSRRRAWTSGIESAPQCCSIKLMNSKLFAQCDE